MKGVLDNLCQWVEAVACFWIGGWILFVAVWMMLSVLYGIYVLLARVENPLDGTVFGRVLGVGYLLMMAWILFPSYGVIRVVYRVFGLLVRAFFWIRPRARNIILIS